ncbi:menaquinone biosynthesis prenyltransferase MqnP [Campylobacter troglodytis]|uniref:menaquinone biosynthesis prenyltransferase MqnP n=1 Tax=Campylobacter troglodytis TaxID=654363 RepID=UPI0011583508|nr:menaquinone biosynthesis prenyltransferase MqnP [Campylobacter troglodytis]TQR53630.1 4-hydroxybenzoate polyprenyltransferase [Campylobacter troglodytis]
MSVVFIKFKDLLELIVFKHSIFALPFLFSSICAAYFIANEAHFTETPSLLKALILGIIAAVSARNFAMAVNRLMDEDIDKNNPRCKDRPNINGRIGRGFVLSFIALNACVFVLVSYFINPLAFKISFFVLFVLAIYSAFKRFSYLCHLVLGLCLGFAAIAGSVLILNEIHLYSIMLCLGVMFWTAGFDLLYALQDMEYDKRVGLYSIPSKFGKDATFFISGLFHCLAVLFWLLFANIAKLGVISYIGIILSAFILVFEHKIVRKNFSQINRAFFTLNGYLSIVFFVFIFVDVLAAW